MPDSNDRLQELKRTAKDHGGFCLSEKFVNSNTKLKFKCSHKHIWECLPYSILKGSWCPTCAIERRALSRKDNIEIFKQIAEAKGGKCLSDKYINALHTLQFECIAGHKWNAQPQRIKLGQWCRKCSYQTIAAKLKLDISEVQKNAKAKGGKLISNKFINCGYKNALGMC